MNKQLYLLLLLLVSLCSEAQDFKIDRVTKKDFEEKFYELDPTASAVVEHNLGKTYFIVVGNHYQLVTETKTRIKIFTKDAYDYATVNVPLYRDRSTRELLSVSSAYTYNLVDDKVERTRLNTSAEFIEKVQGNHYLASFTMPNVREGSIIEYTTKITSPYITDIPEWYFQLDIPVKISEFELKIPEKYMFYKYIKGTEKVNQRILGDKYVYTAKNVPALKEESYVNNIDNYRASIIHTFSAYREASGSFKTFGGTWAEVVKTINDYDGFGGQLKRTDFAKSQAMKIVANLTSDVDKATAIVQFLQNEFTWNQTIGIETSKDLKDVMQSKNGSSVEINLLGVSMMRSVNVNAYPVLLATRNKGVAYMPSISAFNNVIIGLESNTGNVVLFDASDKFSKKDILPIHNLNWIGRLVRPDGTSKDVLLEPKVKSRQSVNALLNLNPADGSIQGELYTSRNNYEAYLYRSFNKQLPLEKIADGYEERYSAEIDSFNLNNFDDLEENVVENMTINRPHSFDIIGDKIYLTPAFIFKRNENPFKLDQRTYPLDFIYPSEQAYTLVYNIPDGYEVENVPESKKISTGTGSVSAQWVITYDEQQIRVRWSLSQNNAHVDAREYPDVKTVYEELVKFMDQKIVLKRK